MKLRSLIILLAAFIALVSVVFVKRGMEPPVPTTEEMADIVPSSLNLENLHEVVFRFGATETHVHLIKEEGHWKVKSLYDVSADENALAAFLKKIDTLQGEWRSSDAGLFEDYGIADASGVHIVLSREGGAVVHLVVGLKRAGWPANFIRHRDKNEVYLVGEDLLAEFGLWAEPKAEDFNTEKWMDKQIVRFEPQDVTAFQIVETRQGVEKMWLDLALKTDDDKTKWESALSYAFGLSAAKIKNQLQNLLNLRAFKVVAADTTGAFGDSFWRVELKLRDGRQIALLRGSKDKEGSHYYVKVAEDYDFLVPVPVFDNLVRNSGDIFIANPLEITEEGIAGVEIQDVTAKKKFSAVKAAKAATGVGEMTEADESEEGKASAVWKTPGGTDIDNGQVEGMIQKLKNMNLSLAFTDEAPANTALLVKLGEGEGVKTKTYAFSESKAMDGGRECHFLRISGDPHAYCCLKGDVDNFKSAVPFSP